jgi:nucleoside-diphosphate-sugar epimerase
MSRHETQGLVPELELLLTKTAGLWPSFRDARVLITAAALLSESLPTCHVSDVQRAVKALGLGPRVPLREAMRRTANWNREQVA